MSAGCGVLIVLFILLTVGLPLYLAGNELFAKTGTPPFDFRTMLPVLASPTPAFADPVMTVGGTAPGASGGVGSVAVAILAARGHEVWAATGKADEEPRLRALGAVGIVPREECTVASGRPLESARWAGAVDTVGAPTLPWVLRTLRPGAAVASSGNAGGAKLDTTVLPFILRGVALLGMDSANMPIEDRRALWRRIATDLRPTGLGSGDGVTEIGLDGLDAAFDAILAGRARGRWVVRVPGEV